MIAAIPIATPVVVTATMAIGARKMAQAHAVVTKLSAIEELAGMTTLCSDKTGTLTKNVLTIDTPYVSLFIVPPSALSLGIVGVVTQPLHCIETKNKRVGISD
jgi:P-type E1-E2 ATPase